MEMVHCDCDTGSEREREREGVRRGARAEGGRIRWLKKRRERNEVI